MRPRFFKTSAELNRWLQTNHRRRKELWVGLQQRGASRPGVSRAEVVDAALTWGWAAGTRKSLPDGRAALRLTPREPQTRWSTDDVRRFEELLARGQMKKFGLAAFEARDPTVPKKPGRMERLVAWLRPRGSR